MVASSPTKPRTSSQTQITVTLPDGRDITFRSGLWRREENILVIDNEEDPIPGERREILAIFRDWWCFRVVKSPS